MEPDPHLAYSISRGESVGLVVGLTDGAPLLCSLWFLAGGELAVLAL